VNNSHARDEPHETAIRNTAVCALRIEEGAGFRSEEYFLQNLTYERNLDSFPLKSSTGEAKNESNVDAMT
jgi:hypothetical protein